MKSSTTRNKVVALLNSLVGVGKDEDGVAEQFKSKQAEMAQDDMALSTEEWSVILDSGDTTNRLGFCHGDAIIEEGLTYRALFQTITGEFAIYKRSQKEAGQGTRIGTVDQGEVLGEINFFTRASASASVVVSSNTAEVVVIDKEFLSNELLLSHPDIVLRFYYHLCFMIGRRLTKLLSKNTFSSSLRRTSCAQPRSNIESGNT